PRFEERLRRLEAARQPGLGAQPQLPECEWSLHAVHGLGEDRHILAMLGAERLLLTLGLGVPLWKYLQYVQPVALPRADAQAFAVVVFEAERVEERDRDAEALALLEHAVLGPEGRLGHGELDVPGLPAFADAWDAPEVFAACVDADIQDGVVGVGVGLYP